MSENNVQINSAVEAAPVAKTAATLSGVSFNPMAVTQPQDSFHVSSNGYVQGAYEDDNASRQWLLQGVVGAGVTDPVYPGIPIRELTGAGGNLGNTINLSTDIPTISGFTTALKFYNAIATPGNPVPQVGANMSASYFRLGSNARIAVKCSPSLANTISGGQTNQLVSWDFTNQQLIAYSSGLTALPVKVLNVISTSRVINNSATPTLSYETGPAVLIQI